MTLKYSPPGQGAHQDDPVRTAAIYRLGFRYRQSDSRWHFHSLAQLVGRSDVSRHVQPNGWNGNLDLAILKIPLDIGARGRFQEAFL